MSTNKVLVWIAGIALVVSVYAGFVRPAQKVETIKEVPVVGASTGPDSTQADYSYAGLKFHSENKPFVITMGANGQPSTTTACNINVPGTPSIFNASTSKMFAIGMKVSTSSVAGAVNTRTMLIAVATSSAGLPGNVASGALQGSFTSTGTIIAGKSLFAGGPAIPATNPTNVLWATSTLLGLDDNQFQAGEGLGSSTIRYIVQGVTSAIGTCSVTWISQ